MRTIYKAISFACIPAFMLLSGGRAGAQEALKPVKPVVADFHLKQDTSGGLTISFISEELVYNLLVKVTSAEGETLFLDNQYRFMGGYKQVVPLEKEKGTYTVEITKDKERVSQRIEVK